MRPTQLAIAALLAGCSSGETSTATAMPATAVATALPATVMPTMTAAPATLSPATATSAPVACGERGQPSCPLQAFMKTKMGPTLQQGDLAGLATLLDQVAGAVPDPSFDAADPRWSKIAQDGAAAARANDTAGSRAACKSCHTAHQKRFKTDFRTWPVPPGMQ